MNQKIKGRLLYGGDYNPEQWPEEVWAEDVRLMREASVNIVSIGIFSWARLEREEGIHDFGWLDRIMDLLHANGVHACLATATASPPPWLTRKYPSILPVTAEGVVLHPGSRQQYSPCSADYHRALKRLVRAIATRYRQHPALAAWHINNEYGCHVAECHGEETTSAFRLWLKNRYKTLDALNAAWGTDFWSQIYTDWEEIFTPRKAPTFVNPAHQLDYRRFMNHALLECCRMEIEVLREVTPDVPVTTNLMGFHKWINGFRWARELDFVSWDSYPDPEDEAAGRQSHAMGNDLTRSLKPEVPFILMEQAPSAVNWRPVNRPKRPGIMRLWSMQTVARGADGVMFFQWRASKAGAEKFHSGLVQHAGAERSRVFREVRQLGAELERLRPVVGSRVAAKAAIAFDWDNWWSLEFESHPKKLGYIGLLNDHHRWFYERNIAVDFVHPEADFSAYRLVVAPTLYLLTGEAADNLRRFVVGGGHLLATFFTGIVDEQDQIRLGGYPALLRDTLGLWVEEWCPYPDGAGNRILWEDGDSSNASYEWADLAHLESARSVATFQSDFFAGRPALTRNEFGKGLAWYLATRLRNDGIDRVLRRVVAEAGVAAPMDLPSGVECVVRRKGNRQFVFLLNHTDKPMAIDSAQISGTNLLTRQTIAGQIDLPPLEVAVIECEIDGVS